MRIFTLYTAGLLLFPLTVFTLDPGFLDLQFDGPMTFWVDQTCRSTRRKEAFNAALDEAIKMASRAYYRLGISTDALTAGNINILFHEQNVQGQQDKTRNLAKKLFGTQPHAGSGISVWKEDQDRLKSNIRIYCDGDPQKTNPNRPSRWKLAPDPALDKQPQGYVKQSARPRAGPGVPKPWQEWQDEANRIKTTSRGCNTNGANGITLGHTFTGLMNIPQGQPQQAAMRSTITICDSILDGAVHSFTDLEEAREIKDVSRLENVDAFLATTFAVIAHEFLRVRPARLSSPTDPAKTAYGWGDCISLDEDDSLNNANNFVFLELLARLQDWKFKLPDLDNVDGWFKGKLEYDDSIGTEQRRSILGPRMQKCPARSESGATKGLNCLRFRG